MVDMLEVIYAVVRNFKKCVPNTKQYLGTLPENFEAPCLLYLLVFNADEQATKFTKDTSLDLQVIYFNTKNAYGTESFEDKLKLMTNMKQFLSQFNIKVGDRNLKFKYSFGEADGQLTVNMQFKFKDGLVDIKYDEEQARDMIERIFINEEEVV